MSCKTDTGCIWNYTIYEHMSKGTEFYDKYKNYSLATKSVMTMMDLFLEKGYCATLWNFYTSPELVDLLVTKKAAVYGAV